VVQNLYKWLLHHTNGLKRGHFYPAVESLPYMVQEKCPHLRKNNSMGKQNFKLIPVITVFFFWGFVAASNDILIPVFKDALHLAQWQSQMISFAFYIAYTVGSLLYMAYAYFSKQDLVEQLGFKRGLMLGLIISAFGTLLFYPAAIYSSFLLMIIGLFIVGLGFSLQQIVANPLTIALGNPETGSQRLSLAGGINNIGTTIGPLLVSYAIFGFIKSEQTVADLNAVKMPYLILGASFVLMAIVLHFSSVPSSFTKADDLPTTKTGSALQFPQLVLGMIAIFVYVGVEVSTASNLPELMKQELNMPTSSVAPYVSLFWASLMIGRWTSAADAFANRMQTRKILRFVMPYLAFGLFLSVNAFMQQDVSIFYVYAVPIMILIAADFYCMGNPSRQLLVFSMLGILSLLVSMFTHGMLSIYAVICVGLFCSTLWPCIFTIAINGLGKFVTQGSGFLIMMIMGGGIISLLQGTLADDSLLGIKQSYWIGVCCFAYLAWYAWKFKKPLVNIEQSLSH